MDGSTPVVQLQHDDVELLDKELMLDEFFQVFKYKLKHQKFDGSQSNVIDRLVYERGSAAAVLPYDPNTDEVILVEQFRIGAYANSEKTENKCSPWLIECIAGMIEPKEEPADVATREALEEADITISHLKEMMAVYTSPGGTAEKIHLFAALVDSSTAGGVHGLADENEDIRVLKVPFAKAQKMVENGQINNAPTVIAIQWLQLNKSQWLQSLA